MHLPHFLFLAVPLIATITVNAESHVIKFVNQCGFGSPALIQDGTNILVGDEYTTSGPYSGIAYLQTGYCLANGENCTLLEMTMINPTCAGCGSTTDISLIPPHAYSVETSFAYYGGCDGEGKMCSDPDCSEDAFFTSTDYVAQVACQVENVNLLVAFCADASELVLGGSSPSSASPSSVAPLTTGPSEPTTSMTPSSPATSSAPTAPVAPSIPAAPSSPPATPCADDIPSAPGTPTASAKRCRNRPTDTPSLAKREHNVPAARARLRRARFDH
ncbi:hypothetical protein BU15DRAFT_71144 [Melanogaster broomeanus]|nr:hypothetical protein BU15DRAFT_71144 [Melanogaster broomeanus]